MDSQQREREIRRRREEQRRLARRRQERKTKKAGKKKSFGLIFMLCLLLVGGLITASFTVLFPVKNVLIDGDSRYTDNQILAAASITEGSNLLRLNPDKIEDNIRSKCPYITGIKLQRKLPSKVIITVTEDPPALAFPVGKSYVLATDSYEYIETSQDPLTATVVYGLSVTPDVPGQPVTFSDTGLFEQLEILLRELQNQSITEITKIDMRDLTQIRLLYKNLHIWELGDLTNLSYKLRFGAEVSNREINTGTIDLSALTTGKSGYFKGDVLGEFVTGTDVTATDAAVF